MSAAARIRLRQDLTLHRGPDTRTGAPTWTLHDPVRNLHYFIDWSAFEVISRINNNQIEDIVDSISETTILNIDSQDVERVLEFLQKNELLQSTDSLKVDSLIEKTNYENKHLFKVSYTVTFFLEFHLSGPTAS